MYITYEYIQIARVEYMHTIGMYNNILWRDNIIILYVLYYVASYV